MSTNYVIKAVPGRPATVHLLGGEGDLQAFDPSFPLPEEVMRLMAWLSAFADGHPLPPGHAPPVLLAPATSGDPFIAMTSGDQPA
jgi:hypothetical protein